MVVVGWVRYLILAVVFAVAAYLFESLLAGGIGTILFYVCGAAAIICVILMIVALLGLGGGPRQRGPGGPAAV